jgi:hypothetical protein
MSKIQQAVQKMKEFETQIITKALEDDSFRTKLFENPREVLAQEAGKEVPEGLKINIIEEEAGSVTIVIPRKISKTGADGELSEEALEKVAGGAIVSIIADIFISVGL